MDGFFTTLATVFLTYKYPLIFLGTLVEGPIVMFAGGILLHHEEFLLLPLYTMLMFGDLVADVLWYTIGRFFAGPVISKYGYVFGVSSENFEKMKLVFLKHDLKILFISKITMGFGFAVATIAAAGAARVPFKKFISLNFFGGLIWTAMLVSFGYFFGGLYKIVSDGFKIVFLFASAVIFLALLYGFMKFVKSKYKF